MISAASSGISAAISRALTEPWPLPTIWSRVERSAADGIGATSPATEPISIQVSGFPLSVRASDDRDHRRRGGFAPEIVDHHVDIPRGFAEPVRDVVRLALEQNRVRGAKRGQLREAVRIARCGNDPACAEELRDLNRHAAGVTGGGEHQDALARLERHPLAQRNP